MYKPDQEDLPFHEPEPINSGHSGKKSMIPKLLIIAVYSGIVIMVLIMLSPFLSRLFETNTKNITADITNEPKEQILPPEITSIAENSPPTNNAPSNAKDIDTIWEELEKRYPTVTPAQLSSGDYADKFVCMEAVVDNVRDSDKKMSFDLWYLNNDTYLLDPIKSLEKNDEIQFSQVYRLKDGDKIKICLQVYSDNSFGPSKSIAIKIIDNISLESIYQSYKEHCQPLNYDAIMENGSDYFKESFKVTGKIVEIIEQTDKTISFLLKTEDGIVYIKGYNFIGQYQYEKFSENDDVIIYGNYYSSETYTNAQGIAHTVPYLIITFIE